jgi:hypothetical protein
MEGWSNGNANSATTGIPDPAMDSSVSRIRTSSVGVAREGTTLETASNVQTIIAILAPSFGHFATIARVATSLTVMAVVSHTALVERGRDLITKETVSIAQTIIAPTVLTFGPNVRSVTVDMA